MSLQDDNPNSNNLNNDIEVTKYIQDILKNINKNIKGNDSFQKKYSDIYNDIYNKQIFYNKKEEIYYTKKGNNIIDITTIINLIDLCCGLSDLAYKDELTKIYNRRKMKEMTNKIFNNNLEQDIYIAIIDLDNFKKINDKYGHPNGDKVLEKLVELIQKFIKEPDMLFRYGGEEFTIIFNNKNKNEVLEILKRIQEHINDALFLDEVKCSVSIGVAPKEKTYEETIYKADKALYWVKQNGKNNIRYAN